MSGKKGKKASTSEHTVTDEKKFFAALTTDLEQKVWDIAGPLGSRAQDLREKPPVDFLPYLENGFISYDEFSFINACQYAKSKDDRDMLIAYFKELSFKAIVKLVQTVSVVEEIEKFLVLIDDMLVEDMARIEQFNKEIFNPWKHFVHLLGWTNAFVRNIASRIITKLMVGDKSSIPTPGTVKFFLEWLKKEMKDNNKYLISVTRCLQRVLRVDQYRLAFMNLSGILKIIKLLSSGVKPQVQYQLCFCLWVTTFNPNLAEKMNRMGIIPVLVNLMESCPSENTKLPRVVTATLRNLLEKPHNVDTRRNNALVMIQCKLLQYMDIAEEKTDFDDDPEYKEDFETVREVLNACVTELTSFDEYYLELTTHRLTWSVLHTSKRFWVENAEHLNDNKYELLKILIEILEECKDNTALCIASHDIGEYVKHYPRGKILVHRMGGKDALIRLASHNHPAVRFHALKSLQVIMLRNQELFKEFKDVKKTVSEKWDDKIGFGM